MIESCYPATRDDWMALRRNNVGASEVAALLGAHDYLTAYELWARKSGFLTQEEETPAMRRGRLLEDDALQVLAEEHPDWRIKPNPTPGTYFQDRDYRLGASPDAFVINEKGCGVCQVKSIEALSFHRHWKGENGNAAPVAPLGYAVQTIVEAWLSGAQWAMIAAVIVDHGIRVEVVDVPIHEGILERVRNEAINFWRLVAEGSAPELDYRRDAKLIDKLYAPTGEILDLSGDNELMEILAEREELNERKRWAEARLSEIRATILDKLGGASEATLPDGGMLSVKRVNRKAFEMPATSFIDIRIRRPKP